MLFKQLYLSLQRENLHNRAAFSCHGKDWACLVLLIWLRCEPSMLQKKNRRINLIDVS